MFNGKYQNLQMSFMSTECIAFFFLKVLVLQKSYGGSEVLEIETRIRLIHGNSTSFVFEGHDSDP